MNQSSPQNFVALDLEYNQPSQTVIQVGVAIGNADHVDDAYTVRKWTLLTGEPIAPFITGLTGISDEDVSAEGVTHAQCAAELSELLVAHKVFVNPVTWGGGDSQDLLRTFSARGAPFPHFGRRWIDVKTWTTLLSLSRPGGSKSTKGGLSSVMASHKLHFKGKAHRADVDAFNTLRLFFRILERQRVLESAVATLRDV